MIYVIKLCVAFNIAYIVVLCIFVVFGCKDIALLLGGCGSVSGNWMGETHLRFVGLVSLGVRFVFRVGRIFFSFLFNTLNINLLWVTSR